MAQSKRPEFRIGFRDRWFRNDRLVYVGDRVEWWHFTPADLATIHYLDRVAGWRCESNVPLARDRPLIAFLDDLREILRCKPINGLTWAARHGHPDAAPLAMFLLGHCEHPAAEPYIRQHLEETSPELHKEALRALRNLGLPTSMAEDVADAESHPDVRGTRGSKHSADVESQPKERKIEPYRQRLSAFLNNSANDTGDESLHRGERMVFWMHENMGPGRPPKSASLIRRILERIRRLVRGVAS